jgi:hypothetical protein
VEQLEETALQLSKAISKLGREAKGWPVWSWLKERVDAFKRTMPLITDLRNPALRRRHWDQLAEHVGVRWAAAAAAALRVGHTSAIARGRLNPARRLAPPPPPRHPSWPEGSALSLGSPILAAWTPPATASLWTA